MRLALSQIGKYELRNILASNRTSTVYDGWDSDIARRVAIKMIPLSGAPGSDDAEAFIRFKRGAQAAGQLNHPNIVAVYDYGEADGFAYLVMEFIDGPTLKDRLAERQRFSLSETCTIIGNLLEALRYSHGRGVMHRDIKPDNIMFTLQNEVKITDFGIARLEDSDVTQNGIAVGSPPYMSPEQFLGERVDAQTDIYSTGIVLYEMLTGERAFNGTLATIMHKVLYGSVPVPSLKSISVSLSLDKVVARATDRDRQNRFVSAAEFRSALLTAAEPEIPAIDKTVTVPLERLGIAARVKPPATARILGAVTGHDAVLLGAAGVAVVVASTAAWYTFGRTSGHKLNPPIVVAQQTPAPAISSVPKFDHPVDAAAFRPVPPLPESSPVVRDEQPAEPVAPAAPLGEPIETRHLAADEATTMPVSAVPAKPARIADNNPPPARKPVVRSSPPPSSRDLPDSSQSLSEKRLASSPPKSVKPVQEAMNRPGVRDPASTTAGVDSQARNELPAAPADPAPTYAVVSSSSVGLLCQAVTADTAGKFGLDRPQGMVVTGVTLGSAAARAGIRRNDVILEVKGQPAATLSALSKVASEAGPGQPVPVTIMRNGSRQVVMLDVAALHH